MSEKKRTGAEWYDEVRNALNDRDPFSFDLESDTLYRQYRDQYQNLGQKAMEDTMGQAAGLTGGYGSTYGERAGAEAYNDYLSRLNDIVPELYDRQRAAYDKQTDALFNELDLATDERDAAFDRCMTLLEKGLSPTQDDLAAAGLPADFAQTAMAVFNSAGTGSGTSGSGSGSHGRSSVNNGGLTADQIRELQRWLGVTADGGYGKQTRAAADKCFGGRNMTAKEAWDAYVKILVRSGVGNDTMRDDRAYEIPM